MVRVISVHNFASQHIQLVEQPTACTVAKPDRLLLALSSHCIEVHDLKENGDILFTFPTVDEVTQIVHCLNGDYVATLESKRNRQNKEFNFVRVYVNWASVATLQQSKMTTSGVSLGSSECGMVQPMRARIAGRVTPTTNQSEVGSLEMIEIPMRNNPDMIDCCQISGNILIASKKELTIYSFQVKVHDISKLRFIDFEELPLHIELSFRPEQISLCENYISCMNHDTTHMFKIVQSSNRETDNECDNFQDSDFAFKYVCNDETVDYKQLLKEECLKTNPKDRITINLPSIIKENSLIHKYSPFTFSDKDIKAFIKSTASENLYEIQDLIQLKLVPVLIENAQRQVAEEFKYMVVKPLYIDQSICKNVISENKYSPFKSKYSSLLHSITCMVATQQEGYLYQFCDLDTSQEVDNCIAVYPFTAPVYKLVMENHLLHALTETGLESYTLRTGHQLCRKLEQIDDTNIACPPVSDSVCLVGLRPFLGVEKIILSNNYLVLLASADSSPTHSIGSNSSCSASIWTMYKLELPTTKAIFNDISIVANQHRFSSTQTYCHLMSEAHMILRINLLLAKWGNKLDGNVTLVSLVKHATEELIEAYRTSCALLGDHFMMCSSEEEYKLGLPYYKMAGIQPHEVLNRVKKVQIQSNNFSTKGLLYYLRTILLDLKGNGDAEKLFGSGSKQNFVECVLELFENQNYDNLAALVIKSQVLREYAVDKLINILDKTVSNDSLDIAEKTVALTLLHIQRCNHEKAKEIVSTVDNKNLFKLLNDNWELLFDSTNGAVGKSKQATFSEFCVVLFSAFPELLAEFFISLIMDSRVISLNKVLKAFLDYLPSNIGTDGNAAGTVLQKTLELYFRKFFARNETIDLPKIVYDRATHEAMKILVRSYLSQLQILQLKEFTRSNKQTEEKERDTKERPKESDNEDKDEGQEKWKLPFEDRAFNVNDEPYLFAKYRYTYLDKMPPFQIEITSKIYEVCLENYSGKEQLKINDETGAVLKKLQALLCSQAVPKQVIVEVGAFLELNETFVGNDSLKSITMNITDAITFLLDVCPQCLLEFGKDRFTKTDEWKFLIATVQQRILRLSQNQKLDKVCFFHRKLLKDILTHIATSITLDQLVQVFPQRLSVSSLSNADTLDNSWIMQASNEPNSVFDDAERPDKKDCFLNENVDILNEIQNYEPYVVICKETMHANQIRKLITTTAQQLLHTLNFSESKEIPTENRGSRNAASSF